MKNKSLVMPMLASSVGRQPIFELKGDDPNEGDTDEYYDLAVLLSDLTYWQRHGGVVHRLVECLLHYEARVDPELYELYGFAGEGPF